MLLLLGHAPRSTRPKKHKAGWALTRRLAVGFILLALFCRPAIGGDFALNYAVEAEGKTGSGRLESCGPERVCRFRAADLDVEVLVHPDTDGFAAIDMVVRGAPGCCHTIDSRERFELLVKPGLLRVAIYRRMSSGPDDFVRTPFSWSRRVGTVYLEFQKSAR
ncbi:hypothetical protein ACQR0Z_09245 [Bradyrhizobium sp. HKCCYLS3077]|uniref:hypothetical protein n=1 Tax=Bradyrhizobium sp. HKCCYLS3077 TaxID=3420761 RepID=UPI003EBBBCF9